MKTDQGNGHTHRKLYQWHFVYHKSCNTWDRTLAAAVGGWRLPTWDMAWPIHYCYNMRN
jgi:hypothetical protein